MVKVKRWKCIFALLVLVTVTGLMSLNIQNYIPMSYKINMALRTNSSPSMAMYSARVHTQITDGLEHTEDDNEAVAEGDLLLQQLSAGDVTHISQACPWNSGTPPLDDKMKTKYEIHDLFRLKTSEFLSNYKNPCWRKENTRQVLCLPYFYVVGFPKCGSTFTFSTIVGHPEVAKPQFKETQWIARRRFDGSSNLDEFLDMFSSATRIIEKNMVTDNNTGKTFHPMITGEGSPSTAWQNSHWRHLPGNYNCTEPRVLNPHYIYHLNPATKIIIVIRNPTDMRISEYNFFNRHHPTAEKFHEEMVDGIQKFEGCLSRFPLRTCAYNNSEIMRTPIGLYHVFISDWMKVFPREQILLVRLEDTHDDPYSSFSNIFEFLGLSHVSRLELQNIMSGSRMNQRKRAFTAKNETRRILDDFFKPHNIQLAKLLNNTIPIYG
ncbi:carbohydrate sulfotransferase 15-like [Haliotis rubra]|uniref:carbohydrate sulfotransferase 15-like n=1 Tax=Haliotis rubra TaxID=36100 RepID=UPI001EE5C885|nr:carbohydrate sulfotransferase 15-like [Haliotis rubra]